MQAFDSSCTWPVSYADCSGACSAYERWPEEPAEGQMDRAEAQALFEAQAIELLWETTGRVFGVCEIEVRPCRSGCAGDESSTFWGRGPGFDTSFPRQGGGSSWRPALIRGEWTNITCGCLTGCSCSPDGARSLALPGPITEIVSVMIDGALLDPSAYRVDHARLLVRQDGGEWPACQDMSVGGDQPGSFVVKYKSGVAVPVGGQIAAGRLACELALAACKDSSCALPKRLQSITREGVTVGIALTGQNWYDTGIWSIDTWINAVVKRPRGYASVRSVDVPVGPRGY